ncbi:crossover junction endonuclease EME1-like isoform X2 [Choristoneura fumiferana]|uniref:crossover junction endonuclease EME1-like isoform X2 n=1 Tax=Choristoneura fumiferana TaxID=7141 RepID=UPI003D153CDD
MLNMSISNISISSDDSETLSDYSNQREFNILRPDDAEACVDLTQEYVDQYEPSASPTYETEDDILPAVQLSGTQVATLGSSRGVSATSVSSAATSSSGYGGSGSVASRRRSVEDKSKKKKAAAEAKLAKKQKLAEDRLARQAVAEMNKVYKPGECMKYMQIELHPSLLGQWYCADLEREAAACGARVAPTPDLCDPALVLWSRRTPRGLTEIQGQMALSPSVQRCARALYVCACDAAAPLVRARSLAATIAHAKVLAGCPLTLVVHGVKDYFKSSNRRTVNSSRDVITEIELEMALTDLIVSAGCDTAIVNTPNELALLVMQFTKAIAEEPHKKIKRNFDEKAEFYMRGDNKKCVPMDKDGNGASRLWQQMIAVLPGSSLETSRSICGQYKSPLALFTELQSSDGANKLAELGVSRTGVPGAKSRRLGPEFARKLRTLFTTEDGDVLLD